MTIFKNLFKKQQFKSGILEDNRTFAEKEKDYQTEELFGDIPLDWVDYEIWKTKNNPQYEIQNQDGSSSCVANSGALISAINNLKEENKYLRMSARWIYSQRSNKPSEGMIFDNLGQILTKSGTIPEKLMSSEGLSEQIMNDNSDKVLSFDTIANIYKAKNYFYLNTNINSIAQILSKDKPVVIGVAFGDGEWNKELPIMSNNVFNYRHAIVALPNAYFTYQGKKAILIQDSWGVNTGLNGKRIITEDWFSRIFTAMWFEDISNLALNTQIEKPKYKFSQFINVGNRGVEVAMLQKCLGYLKDNEGYLFPLNQSPTGNYFGITKKAVERYQKMKLLTITGSVNNETLIELNKDFS